MNLKGIKLTWLGHATFRIETPGGKTVIIDPWFVGNPICPQNEKDVKTVDVLLCTHAPADHIGAAVEIAMQHNLMVVAIYEMGTVVETRTGKEVSGMGTDSTQTVAQL